MGTYETCDKYEFSVIKLLTLEAFKQQQFQQDKGETYYNSFRIQNEKEHSQILWLLLTSRHTRLNRQRKCSNNNATYYPVSVDVNMAVTTDPT